MHPFGDVVGLFAGFTADALFSRGWSRATVYRLINDGQLQRVYPRQKAARITRESLNTLLEKAKTPGAVATSIEQNTQAKAQAAKVAEQQHQEDKKKSLAERWGLGAIFGNSGDVARGAGAGGVVGGARGAASGEREKDQVLRNCLRGRGYRVLN